MIGDDKVPRNILKLRFEERLMELERKINTLKSTDRRYSLDMQNLKNTYNVNLKLARVGGLLDDDDPRVYL
tara:strand:- start:623 stop:835 length:213 start_codon:yes stop_codon:yes gene_type:complete